MKRDIRELSGLKGQPKVKVILKPPIQRLQSLWDRGRFYEHNMLKYVYQHYGKLGGVWIDGGSNIGNHTLFFAKYCNPELIISIDAVNSYLKRQIENLKLNGLTAKVRQFNVALSDNVGTGKMVKGKPNLNPNARWPWHLGMYELDESQPGSTKVTTLDTILNENKIAGITLVKLDIEGSELKALRGATEMIDADHPVLFLEVTSKAELIALNGVLKPFGYKPGESIYPKVYEFKVK